MMPDRRDAALEMEEHMTDVHILAIDLAKRSFQICATAAGGRVWMPPVLQGDFQTVGTAWRFYRSCVRPHIVA
ncbi:hypothetical protein M529_20625 [Sphingobium ummariense RL-3]|uniref:Uncharacterized protein n=1 Tax=Sphingobium ummariense RL-3 TaxID=1346791 RepID=T0IWX7_9SPHN|nr:hypothetical protein M529_20625 [Sphingobium ummariense RL-3]